MEQGQKMQENMKAIYDNSKWLEKVKKKAIKKYILLDFMVRTDAIWIIDNP